jgi:hypothetical protein
MIMVKDTRASLHVKNSRSYILAECVFVIVSFNML